MVTFTSKNGVHRVVYKGVVHIFDENIDSLENKTALSMAWDYIKLLLEINSPKKVLKTIRVRKA